MKLCSLKLDFIVIALEETYRHHSDSKCMESATRCPNQRQTQWQPTEIQLFGSKFRALAPVKLRQLWCASLKMKNQMQTDSTKTSRPTKKLLWKIIVHLLDVSELERRSGLHHFRLQWIAFFGHQFIATIVGAAALSQTGAFIHKWGAEAAIWSSIVAGDAIVTSNVVSIIIGRRHCW